MNNFSIRSNKITLDDYVTIDSYEYKIGKYGEKIFIGSFWY